MNGKVAKRIRKSLRGIPMKETRLVKVNQRGTVEWEGWPRLYKMFKKSHRNIPQRLRPLAYKVHGI